MHDEDVSRFPMNGECATDCAIDHALGKINLNIERDLDALSWILSPEPIPISVFQTKVVRIKPVPQSSAIVHCAFVIPSGVADLNFRYGDAIWGKLRSKCATGTLDFLWLLENLDHVISPSLIDYATTI